MSMGTVGTLNIDMAVNIANLHREMQAARSSVEKAMAGIQRAAGLAGSAFGALGVVMSVDAFARWIKGAIDMADKANEMSQKIGVSVKDIGGLQLAFQQGGIDADGMQTAIAKLSVGIIDGNSALKAMGIATRNADGSLMSTRDVIAQVADQFAGYQDGVAKTALAVELFGRSGADLIPVLNGGSAAFAEFDDWAKRLGISLSEETAQAADKFNDTLDLLQMGTQGIAMGIAAGLLPTLQSLAGEFLTLMSDGQTMSLVVDAISLSLKTLGSIAIGVVGALKVLAQFVSGIIDWGKALASLDFAGTFKANAKSLDQMINIASESYQSIGRLWSDTGNTAVSTMAGMAAASKKAAPEIGKASEEAARAAKKQREEYEKAVKAAKDLVDSIRFETDTQKMSNLEKEIAINLRKLEQTGLQQNTEEYRAYAEAIRQATIENEGIKERIKLEKEAADKRKKIEEDYAREVEQINFQIGQSLTDALINGGKTAKEFLIDMFKTLILRPILQPIITGGTAAITSMLGMSGTANASTGALSQVSALGSIANMANSVKLMSLAALDSVAASAQAATFAVGNALAEMGFETAGTAIFNAAGTMGLIGQGAAGVGAGLLLGSLISGDKSLIGGSQWYATGGGTAIGAAIGTAILPGLGTAIGGALGGIVGGIANAAFGSGEKSWGPIGVRGTVTPAGLAESTSFRKWSSSGGWFGGGGSGESSFATDPGLFSLLDSSVKTVSQSIMSFTGILGINASAIDEYVFRFDEQLGNSVEEQQAKLQEIITRFGEGLASVALGTTDYSKSGESAYETLQRLATSLVTVNTTFDTLGLKLNETSLAGANVASAFVEMMGGVEAFNQATDFYYQNFYSQAERTAKTTENLSDIFKAMNLELPSTREAFRAMVESSRAAGNDVLLANLLKLAPAFIEISQSADSAAQQMAAASQAILTERQALMNELWQLTGNTTALRDTETKSTDEYNQALRNHIAAVKDAQSAYANAKTATDVALENLKRVVDREKALIDQNKQTVQSSINTLTSLFDYLKDQIKDLYQTVSGSSEAAINQAWQYINGVVASGAIPDQSMLTDSVSLIRQSLTESRYKTTFELERDRLVLAGQLEKVAFRVQDQLSVEEEQLLRLESQLTKLDDIYQKAVDQVNEARGIKTSIDDAAMTIESALAGLGASLAGEISALGTMGGLGTSFPSYTDWRKEQISGIYQNVLERSADAAGLNYWSGTNLSISEVQSAIENSVENRTQEITRMYENLLGRSPDAAGLSYWASQNLTLAAVESAIKATTEGQLKGFASGGYYPGGLAMVGERGPELINFSNPGMVYNNPQTRNLLGGGQEVANELRSLREENKAQARSLVQLQTRMTRLIERWDGDGMPETRAVAA